MSVRGSGVDALLTWVLAGLAIWLGVSLRASRADLMSERMAARAVQDSARIWRMESRVVHRLVFSITLPDSIPAIDVVSRNATHLTFAGDRVLYVVSPSCAACAENFPAMQALDSAFPGRVVVVTSAEPEDAVRAYAKLAETVPVLSVAGDVLHQVVSSAVTPITLLSRDRSRLRFWYGQVPEGAQAELRRMLNDTIAN